MAWLTTLAILYLLWVFYLAVMALWRARRDGMLGPVALVPGYLTLLIGAALDVLVNVTVMSLVFVEPPRELLVTKRLQRHIKHGQGWRQELARWLCHNLLNPFDPTGDHCD